MPANAKYDQILDALQILLKDRNIQSISVSEIAQTAGIGKGSIYYYFSSKEEILHALVERSYKKPLQVAHHLAEQTDIPPFTRMAMIFQTCRNSSAEFLRQSSPEDTSAEQALLHKNYLTYLIQELKPELTAIITQAVEKGEIHFEHPDALAEIVLIILTVKLDNTIVPSSPEELVETLRGLIALLEGVTDKQTGALNFLIT